jgi:hypothetical protein
MASLGKFRILVLVPDGADRWKFAVMRLPQDGQAVPNADFDYPTTPPAPGDWHQLDGVMGWCGEADGSTAGSRIIVTGGTASAPEEPKYVQLTPREILYRPGNGDPIAGDQLAVVLASISGKLTDFPDVTAGSDGHVLTQVSAGVYAFQAVGSSGSFVTLSDTPAGYGSSGQVPITNGSANLLWSWLYQVRNLSGDVSLIGDDSGGGTKVNYVVARAAQTGVGAILQAGGGDTNIDLDIEGKGSGYGRLNGLAYYANGGPMPTATNGDLYFKTVGGNQELFYYDANKSKGLSVRTIEFVGTDPAALGTTYLYLDGVLMAAQFGWYTADAITITEIHLQVSSTATSNPLMEVMVDNVQLFTHGPASTSRQSSDLSLNHDVPAGSLVQMKLTSGTWAGKLSVRVVARRTDV